MNVLLPYSHRYIEISREEGSTGVLPDNSLARPTSRCILFDGKNILFENVPWGRLSLWKWVPGISPGVKAAGAYGWRPTTLVVPKRQENPGS